MPKETTSLESQPKRLYTQDDINMISTYGRLFRGDYFVVLQTHAAMQAIQRRIPWELIKRTIYHGKFEKFGDNRIKISKKFKGGKIICVGIIEGEEIRIVTIEVGR